MPSEFIFYVSLGALAGGFINGFAGTGTAIFALGFLLLVLEPLSAVGLVALIAVISGVQGLFEVWSEIRRSLPRIRHFLIPGIIGVPIGVELLSFVDASLLRLLVACMLIVFGGYFGFRSKLPKIERVSAFADSTVGFVGGVLGGLASLSGVLPTLWLSMRPWSKAQTRAILQSYNFVLLSMTVILLAWHGAFNKTTLSAMLIALPVGLIAAQLGIVVFRRVSDDQFRRLLILLCLLCGVGLLLRQLFVE